ncbi:MAG: thermostable hemolysin [Gammaproteobacteria bacterium]|nr:thermostable hemolysin [Gammaproteobacteria bacterium]
MQQQKFEPKNIYLLHELELTQKAKMERHLTESFIHDIFHLYYRADIQHFLPFLLKINNNKTQIIAALGFRPAYDAALFLERYLQKPIEQVLSGTYKQPIDRKDVVEIGNFAIGERGAARTLIVALTGFLFAAQYKWCAFSISTPLINSFRKMGIELETLAPANNDFMSQYEKDSWGKYYEQKPLVMSCCVKQAYQVLVEYVDEKNSLNDIWMNAQHVGSKA